MRMHEILRLLNEILELNRIGLLILDALLIKSTPSYVSEWKSMTANSNTSRVTLSHDLQEAPAYVKVEARTKNLHFPRLGRLSRTTMILELFMGVLCLSTTVLTSIYSFHIIVTTGRQEANGQQFIQVND